MKSAEECAEWFVEKDAEDYYAHSLHEAIRMIQRDALEAVALMIKERLCDNTCVWFDNIGKGEHWGDAVELIRAMKPEDKE